MASFYVRLLTVGAVASLACTSALAENITPDLQFNGYATAGAAWTNNAKGSQYLYNSSATNPPSIGADPSLDYDSVVGLQFNYHANDRTNLITQLAANQGNGNFAVKANWAYIAYRLDDDFTVRAGRFAFPTYLYSENLYVGEAYPWARLPVEIYSTLDGFYNINGVDLLYRKALGDWNLTVQPVLGTADIAAARVNNLTGLTLSLGNDNLTLHLGSIQGSVNLSLASAPSGQALVDGFDQNLAAQLTAGGMSAAIPAATAHYNAELTSSLNAQKQRATYNDAGLIYDDGAWFAAAEYAQFRFKGWVQDFNAGYASVGHYFGDFLPYAVYGRIKDVNNDEATEGFAPDLAGFATQLSQSSRKEQSSLGLGVRYKLRSGVSVKAQVDRINDFHGSTGLFAFTTATPQSLDTVYLYSLSLNMAF